MGWFIVGAPGGETFLADSAGVTVLYPQVRDGGSTTKDLARVEIVIVIQRWLLHEPTVAGLYSRRPRLSPTAVGHDSYGTNRVQNLATACCQHRAKGAGRQYLQCGVQRNLFWPPGLHAMAEEQAFLAA